MNNQEILKKKWKKIDDELKKFYIRFNKNNRYRDNLLQQTMSSLNITNETLYEYASSRKISILEDKLEGIDTSNFPKLKIKKKMTNMELLEAFILADYVIAQERIEEDETNLLKETINIASAIAIKEVEELQDKKINFVITDPLLNLLLMLANTNGYVWQDYITNITIYNANELTRNIILASSQVNVNQLEIDYFKKVLQRQDNRILKYNKKKDNFSGAIETQVTSVYGNTQNNVYKNTGIETVMFIAVMDNATTHMCVSLDGQLFKVNEKNIYNRYSGLSGGIIQKETKGLILGDNLPPINDGFHFCRSTVVPYN